MQEYKFSANPEVEAVVRGVMESIKSPADDLPPQCDTAVLQRFAEIDDEAASLVLGDLAGQLKSFASTVDLNHPSLAWIQEGVFEKGSKFVCELDECCTFAAFAKERKLAVIPQVVREIIGAKGFAKTLSYYFRKPPISLHKTREKRDELRQHIDSKNFDIGSVGGDCANYFNLLPDSFLPYVRCGNGFREEIERNQKTVSTLQTLGLKSQSKALTAYNDELATTVKDTCYGFIRLIFVQAAIIMAKSLGGKLQDNTIYLPSSIFEPLNILYRIENPFVVYQPRIYPYNKVPFEITPFVSNLINEMESYSPIGGFPAFDNYYVVVPTIRIPTNENNRPYLRDAGGIKYFDDVWTACHHLDKQLVESKAVTPVILGESRLRGGHNHFVSYWV